MSITITLEAKTAAELAVLVCNMAEEFGRAPVAPVAVAAPAVLAEPEKPRATRKKALPEGQEKPAFLGGDDKPAAAPAPAPVKETAKPYPIYKADGELFSAFSDPKKAFDRLSQEIAACASDHDLNMLQQFNLATVEKFDEKTQDAFASLLDDRMNALQESADAGDDDDDSVTEEVAEDALKTFIRTKSVTAAREILNTLKANGFKDIKPEQYPQMMQLIRDWKPAGKKE